jgi:hypothetical protein
MNLQMDERTLLTLCINIARRCDLSCSPSPSFSEHVLILGIEPMCVAGDVGFERIYQTLVSSFL